jgi:hypothetical protein
VLLVGAVYPVLAWSNVELLRATLAPISRATGGLVTATLLLYVPPIAVVIGGLLLWLGGLRLWDLGLRRRDLSIGVALTAVAWLVMQLVVAWPLLRAGEPLELDQAWVSAGVLAGVGPLVGQLLGNALYEEVVFRGFLLVQFHKWARRRLPDMPGVALFLGLIGSQLLFALVHIPNRIVSHGVAPSALAPALVLPFLVGILLGLVYYRTGNLFVAIGLHAFMNTPTLLVGPPERGATIAVGLAIVVALGWPWFRRVGRTAGLVRSMEATARSDD